MAASNYWLTNLLFHPYREFTHPSVSIKSDKRLIPVACSSVKCWLLLLRLVRNMSVQTVKHAEWHYSTCSSSARIQKQQFAEDYHSKESNGWLMMCSLSGSEVWRRIQTLECTDRCHSWAKYVQQRRLQPGTGLVWMDSCNVMSLDEWECHLTLWNR